jgi:endonuclease/exonuclease/phosphatase family metal-dependent hydrolase
MSSRRTITALAPVLTAALLLPAAAAASSFPVSRNVGVYSAPDTSSGVGVVKAGRTVDVQCWTNGQAVGGYPVWDRISYGSGTAYVHDKYVQMPNGDSPGANGIPQCGATGGFGSTNRRERADAILAKDYGSFIAVKRSRPRPFNWSSNGCTGPAVIREAYARLFDEPCQQHDWGYGNYGQGLKLDPSEGMRAAIDGRFLTEMRRRCNIFRPGHERSVCQGEANVMFGVVRRVGRPYFLGQKTKMARAAAAVTAQVGTFNMAGNTRNEGRLPVAEDVVESLRARQPVVMMLQETCYAQFHHARARMASRYSGAFFKVPGARCHNGAGSYGNAVLWRRDALAVNHTKQYHLNSAPGLERRQMGCVKSDRPRLVACTLHLSKHEYKSSQDREMAVVSQTVRGWATKYPVVVGGDFNSFPWEPQLNAMYLPDYGGGANGIFREIDDLNSRDGEFTQGEPRQGKFDYIFFTRNLRWHWGDATSSRHSDHVPLWGALTIA